MRIMVEASSQETADRIANSLAVVVKDKLSL